jgi:hypothetical protein
MKKKKPPRRRNRTVERPHSREQRAWMRTLRAFLRPSPKVSDLEAILRMLPDPVPGEGEGGYVR